MKGDEVVYLTPDNIKKTPEGIVMDELRLRKMCCRRHANSYRYYVNKFIYIIIYINANKKNS